MQILFRAIANGGALNGEDQPVDIAAGNGKPVDISDLFFRYTLDAATDFLLGQDVKSLWCVLISVDISTAVDAHIFLLATLARSSPTPSARFSVSRASSAVPGL